MASVDAWWRFVPAGGAECMIWSSGSIESLNDLYSARIFGAAANYRCGCGKTSGEEFVGIMCPSCRVYVTDKAEADRRTLMGKVVLPFFLENPFCTPFLAKEFPARAETEFFP